MNMNSNRERVAYVEGVAKRRGQTAADRLREGARELLRLFSKPTEDTKA